MFKYFHKCIQEDKSVERANESSYIVVVNKDVERRDTRSPKPHVGTERGSPAGERDLCGHVPLFELQCEALA